MVCWSLLLCLLFPGPFLHHQECRELLGFVVTQVPVWFYRAGSQRLRILEPVVDPCTGQARSDGGECGADVALISFAIDDVTGVASILRVEQLSALLHLRSRVSRIWHGIAIEVWILVDRHDVVGKRRDVFI